MTRKGFIERFLIQIYGGFLSDDAEMTYDLINAWIPDAVAAAAKQCYKEAIQLDGIGYVNNGFYSTFSGLAISSDSTDNLCWKFELPEIPPGIGSSLGLSEIRFKSSEFTSFPGIPLSINQWGYFDSMRPINNKILYIQEGKIVRAKTPLILTNYTATIKMISGGDANDLDSNLNVPPDYFPVMQEYLKVQLGFEKAQRQDITSDGVDMP
jgi:hypothetical protein